MLLVVLNHIWVYGYHCVDIESFNDLFVTFRMPLFFFVSGCVMWKASRVWDIKTVRSYLIDKFRVQVMSTLVFLVIYACVFHLYLPSAIADPFKEGYWFTLTLFVFYLFYVATMILVRLFCLYRREDVAIWGGVIFVLLIWVYWMKFLRGERDVFCMTNWMYYVFFCFGVIVRKHFQLFVAFTNKGWVMSVAIVVFLIMRMFNSTLYAWCPNAIFQFFTYGFFGIVIIFTVFRKSEMFWAGNHRLARWMCYVGRHTLDIYLLHYFFLPRHLGVVADFFVAHPNPTVEFFVSMTFALMVVSVCLAVSRVLCTSSLLARFLFGKKAV